MKGFSCCYCAFPYLSTVASAAAVLHRPKTKLVASAAPGSRLIGGFLYRAVKGRSRLAGQVKASEEDEGENVEEDGDKAVQDLLVDMLRLETGKVRVNEFVEDRSKYLTGLAEQASEEFERITEEAKKEMDEAGFKVLEQINAEAAVFEEELAVARAEMEANEKDLDEFEKNVQEARSEGLYFKSLYTKPGNFTSAQKKEIKEKANAVKQLLDQGTKSAAGSKFSRTAYIVMILLVSLSLLEAIFSEDMQWSKLLVYAGLLLALVVRLIYESNFSTKDKEDEKK